MTATEALLVSRIKRADFGNMAEAAAGAGTLGTLANEGSYFVPFVGAGRMLADSGSDFAKGRIWSGLGNAVGGLATGALDAFSGGTIGTAARGAIRGIKGVSRLARPAAGLARSAVGGVNAFSRGVSGFAHSIPGVSRLAETGLGKALIKPTISPAGIARETTLMSGGHGFAGGYSPFVRAQGGVDRQIAAGRSMGDFMKNLPSQLAGFSNPLNRDVNPVFIRPGEGSLPFGQAAMNN